MVMYEAQNVPTHSSLDHNFFSITTSMTTSCAIFSSGERITSNTGGPGLGQITGLDPAEPYFQGYGPAVILDPTDAIFVEVCLFCSFFGLF